MTGASAADMYSAPAGVGGYKDGPLPVQTWTGFYIGVNGGYGWGDSKLTTDALDTKPMLVTYDPNMTRSGSTNLDPSGGFGGGQIGYKLQGLLHPDLVLGVEADIQGSAIEGSKNVTLFGGDFTYRGKSELDWFSTFRGIIGFTFDKTLVYATGGLVVGGVKDSLNVTPYVFGTPTTVSRDSTRVGGVVGAGLERYLTPSLSAKVEYLYFDLGSSTLNAAAGCPLDYYGTASLKSDHTYQTVRFGLNYKLQSDYEPLK
jgi:outer membrane immunogenic protein